MTIQFATNSDREARGFYDEKGNLIYAQQEGSDITFALRALFKYLQIDFKVVDMPDFDGNYPEKL